MPFIILFLTTKVSPQDVFAVGFVPFAASAAAEITRFMLQAARFKYFIKRFIGYDVSSTAKTISARLAGEFVTQTTPSYVGGEFVRIAWLSRHGVPPGKAAWVATMEIIADVFVGSMLAFIAGAFAISKGGSVAGIGIIDKRVDRHLRVRADGETCAIGQKDLQQAVGIRLDLFVVNNLVA